VRPFCNGLGSGPDYPAWLAACVDRASGYNAQFEQPLPAAEVRHTAKSIAKWTHQHLSPDGFSKEQARRGAKGGKASKRPTRIGKTKEDLLPEVLRLKAIGYTNRDIADDLGIGSASVSRYLNCSKNKGAV
jgi:DNA-binding NarL/FixJ family response regulator